MAKIQYEDGTVIEFEGEPTDEDIQSAYEQSQSSAQFSRTEIKPPIETAKGSPLSVAERARLSFYGDDNEGRVSDLKKKYAFVEQLPDGKLAVGNDPRSLQPIDPQGMFNDLLGDTADVVAEIPVVAGQLGGAAMGTATQPGMGTVIGGGAGAMAGEAVKKGIGLAIGVNPGSASEVATDIALTGLFGAGSEGLVIGAKATNQHVIAPFIKKTLTKATQSNPGVTNLLSKVFKITAGVDEAATQGAAKYGYNETLRGPFLDEGYVVPLSQQIADDVAKSVKTLGDDVSTAASRLVAKTNNSRVIDLTDSFQQLTQDLQKIGVLESGNYVNKSSTIKGRDVFTKTLDRIGKPLHIKQDKMGRFGKPSGTQSIKQYVKSDKKWTVGEVLSLRRELQDAFPQMEGNGQAILSRFLGSMDDFTGQPTPGLLSKLIEIGVKVGDDSLPAANAKFSQLMSGIQTLKQTGFNVEDTVALQRSLKEFKSQVPAVKQMVQHLDQITPFNSFFENIEKYSIAQSFKGANPNLLRVGAVLAFMGLNRDDSLISKFTRLGAGIALTTPAGARVLLKTGEKIGKRVGSSVARGGTSLAKKRMDRYAPALLARLLALRQSQKSKESQSGR